MSDAIPQCISMIQECQTNSDACPAAEDFCNAQEFNPFMESGYNPYDIRYKCTGSALCYNFTNVVDYLNQPSVQSALGVNKPWTICNDQVNGGFSKDWMKVCVRARACASSPVVPSPLCWSFGLP